MGDFSGHSSGGGAGIRAFRRAYEAHAHAGGRFPPVPPIDGAIPTFLVWGNYFVVGGPAGLDDTDRAATWASELVAPQTLIQRTSEELRAAILREQELIKKDPNRAVALVNQIRRAAYRLTRCWQADSR